MLLWRAHGLLPNGVMLLARLEFLREPYYKCDGCCDEDPSLYRRGNLVVTSMYFFLLNYILLFYEIYSLASLCIRGPASGGVLGRPQLVTPTSNKEKKP